MSIVVAQLGARMHYAVPRILERAGLLERLYTDICAKKGWPRFLGIIPPSWRPARMQRLLNRVPEGIPPRRITAFTGFGLEYAGRLNQAQCANERDKIFLWSGREFCRHVTAKGFEKAHAVYTFNSAGLEILQEARRQGVKGIMEQTIAPRAVERTLLAEESDRFAGWEPPEEEASKVDEFCAREAAEWSEADLIVCGSEFVRDGVVAGGGAKDRCVVVPYGLESKASMSTKPQRRPGPLRVLTVGAVGLRKGVPYVLEAARQMGSRAEFRIAGAIQILPGAEKQVRRYIQLMGIIPRSEMNAQYEWADVFLLPSLCEGSATVTYEAMFHGLPVICTPQTGSMIRNGLDGFIVPPKDSDAIVEKLERFAAKPDLIAVMSESLRRHSADYTLEKYGGRLVGCLGQHHLIS